MSIVTYMMQTAYSHVNEMFFTDKSRPEISLFRVCLNWYELVGVYPSVADAEKAIESDVPVYKTKSYILNKK